MQIPWNSGRPFVITFDVFVVRNDFRWKMCRVIYDPFRLRTKCQMNPFHHFDVPWTCLSSDRPYERTSARVCRVFCTVNFSIFELTEYLCSHRKTERNKRMAKCNIESTVIIVCRAFLSSPSWSALLCIVRWAWWCVCALSTIHHHPYQMPFIPWLRSKSNLTNASSAYIHTQPTMRWSRDMAIQLTIEPNANEKRENRQNRSPPYRSQGCCVYIRFAALNEYSLNVAINHAGSSFYFACSNRVAYGTIDVTLWRTKK